MPENDQKEEMPSRFIWHQLDLSLKQISLPNPVFGRLL